MTATKKRYLSLFLAIVFVISLTATLSITASAATSVTKTITSNKSVYVTGTTQTNWWWFVRPTTTYTIKNTGGNGTFVQVYLYTDGVGPINKVSLGTNQSMTVSVKGNGTNVKFMLQPYGRRVNGNYGKITINASGGSIS